MNQVVQSEDARRGNVRALEHPNHLSRTVVQALRVDYSFMPLESELDFTEDVSDVVFGALNCGLPKASKVWGALQDKAPLVAQ